MTDTRTSGTQAVDRAALLVSTVLKADRPMTFVDLIDACGLPRSTTSRLLAALERTQLLGRHADGGYLAGPLFWDFAAHNDSGQELGRLAEPVLTEVREETGETVNLGVVRGDQVVHVAQVDSNFLLGTRDWTQIVVPAHTSALGKVMCAFGAIRPPAGPLQRFTDQTVCTRTELDAHLSLTRSRGYATTIDELETGLSAVAAPVPGPSGAVLAAIGISGPTQRIQERVQPTGQLLIDQAERLSQLLRRHSRTEGVA